MGNISKMFLSLSLILSMASFGNVFSMDSDSEGEGKKTEPVRRDRGKESDSSDSEGDGPPKVAAGSRDGGARAGGGRSFAGGFKAALMARLKKNKTGAKPEAAHVSVRASGFADMAAPAPDGVTTEANRALALTGSLNPMMLPRGNGVPKVRLGSGGAFGMGAMVKDAEAHKKFLKNKERAGRRRSSFATRTTAAPAAAAPAPEVEAGARPTSFRVVSGDSRFAAPLVRFQLVGAVGKDDGDDNTGEVGSGRARSSSKDD